MTPTVAAVAAPSPSVSVVIATYHNPPRYSDREFVEEAVASAVFQTCCDPEIVLVDASPDVRNEATRRRPEAGMTILTMPYEADVCETLRVGVRASVGDWIIPMNADDELAPNFVEKALWEVIRGKDGPLRHVGVVVVSEHPITAAIERDNYIPYLAMFARWFWDAMGGFQDVLGEGGACRLADWDLWIRVWQRYGVAAPVAYIHDPSVIKIRNRPDSASKWSSDEFEALRARLWKARGIEP